MKDLLAVLLFCLVTAGFVPVAFAHERRVVADRYEFVVGFINEPAFSGQINGVDLRISQDSKPVEKLEDHLHVIIIRKDFDKSLRLNFQDKYKDIGHYVAYFLPTRAGKYIFRIIGDINGIAIDEVFESGEKFHDVNDIAPLQFP